MPVDPASLRIRRYPDPVLLRCSDPIERVTDEVRAVALRMIELMHEAPGVGLAAPQVGLAWRLFVANPGGDAAVDRIFVNPELHDPSQATADSEEGCLSLPDVCGTIRRPATITIRALNEDAERVELTADDLEARIWQHETDHLDGVLITNRMASIDRMASRRALKTLEQAYEDAPRESR